MGLQLGLDYPELFKALILVGCSSMPGDRYQSRIDGYLKEGVAGFHIKHLTDLVSKDFAESKRGGYLLGMHTEMDARLSAPSRAPAASGVVRWTAVLCRRGSPPAAPTP